jgi:hypothetical protein
MFIRTRTRVRLGHGRHRKPGERGCGDVVAYHQAVESYCDADTGRPRQRILAAWHGSAAVAEAIGTYEAVTATYRGDAARTRQQLAELAAGRERKKGEASAGALQRWLAKEERRIAREEARLAKLRMIAEQLAEAGWWRATRGRTSPGSGRLSPRYPRRHPATMAEAGHVELQRMSVRKAEQPPPHGPDGMLRPCREPRAGHTAWPTRDSWRSSGKGLRPGMPGAESIAATRPT